MAKDPRAPIHPALKFFKYAFLLTLLAFLFTVIALFVPWSRIKHQGPVLAWNGLATYTINSAGNVKTYIGLWKSCIDIDNHLEQTTCINNDNDSPYGPTGVSRKCGAYFVGTQALTIISFILLLLIVVILWKIQKTIWKKPIKLGWLTSVLALLAMVTLFLSWIFWLIYAEENCYGSSGAILNMKWPVQGYSYGFILQIFSWVFMLLALIILCLGCNTLRRQVCDLVAPPLPMYGAPVPAYPGTPPTPYSAPAYPGVPSPPYPPAYGPGPVPYGKPPF